MLSHMRQRLNNWHGLRDAFRKLYLENRHDCVPSEFIGDDLLYAIKGKFYWPFDAVRTQLEKGFGNDRSIYICVNPCWDDTTYSLLTLGNEHLLLSHGSKPWTFWWENESELREDLRRWHQTATARYRECVGLPPVCRK
jgi:hypothetical protein